MAQLHTWDQIRSLFQTVEQNLSEELRHSFDLGINEFRALHQLVERPEREIRMQELADTLQLNQSSMTRLVERLEKKGFVIRDSCPSDRRGKYCVLQKAGEAFILQIIPQFELAQDKVLTAAFSTEAAKKLIDNLKSLSDG